MQRAPLKNALCSVIAIPVTPFEADGQVDFAAYRRLVGRLVDAGISVVTPNGNTSEFYALSPDECRPAVEATIVGAAGRALVIPGVGFDVATAIDLGRFARQAGAVAIMVHQPIHPYRSADGWIAYHQAIASALPDLGIVPYVRDPLVTATMLEHLADTCPNLVGVKYAVPDALHFTGIVHTLGAERISWICGLAEGWAPFFWLGGARGFTSGLANVRPALALQMLCALEAGDYVGAMGVWEQIKPFEDLRARRANANNVPVVKEALAQMGLCGRTVRPPISELPEPERSEVEAILAAWDAAEP